MPHVESRMRNAMHSDDFTRLLGNTFRIRFTNVRELGTAAIENIFIHKLNN